MTCCACHEGTVPVTTCICGCACCPAVPNPLFPYQPDPPTMAIFPVLPVAPAWLCFICDQPARYIAGGYTVCSKKCGDEMMKKTLAMGMEAGEDATRRFQDAEKFNPEAPPLGAEGYR